MSENLERQIYQSWNEVVKRYAADNKSLVRTSSSVKPADLQTAWSVCILSLRERFAAHYGTTHIEARFAVPEDYALFMQAIGGGWHWPYGLERWLFDAEGVAKTTVADFELLVLGALEEEEPVLDSGFWLGIGRYSDKHEYLLCCDRAHRYYGTVFDGHDSHPWLNGVEFGGCYRLAASFLEWLEILAKRA
ncbi:SMI1/KNR4 family protein [Oscillatoria sp. FACHB-1406]|uniref:SMI1/KNR4 family protein n=1 Tax=Oscillatoria sp. FACHB-1406 TaxID=2692846 RepID=UPI001682128B|nr:SMI1/KNR4 family protein [Oscillatoria sp. FACHB-1406]MBD2579480.1 SMI1/KNR4 family protein [Oscillatoria sp. FACHB-1406]